jgi:N-acetylglucosamine kinase-like BadF-type ATPase
MPNFNGCCFLGIDTGATKTHALLTNAAGKVLAFEQGGPGNPQSIGGYQSLERMVTELVQRACQSAGVASKQIHAAGLGLAGYDWTSQYERFYQVIRSAGLPENSFLANDAALGIYAGTSQSWGICVGAGTSFNCRGIGRDGREARAIGDGLKWGEGAGALELAVRAAQMVIAQWLRTGPETRLTDLFMETFDAESLAELVEGMVLRRYPVTAKLAPCIFDVARAGDEPANEAVRWAAGKLADLAIGAARQLDLQEQPFEIVLSGSFFKAGKILIDPMKEKILLVAKHAEFRLLDIPPVCGAVIMAMIKSGSVEVERFEEIKNQFRDYLYYP